MVFAVAGLFPVALLAAAAADAEQHRQAETQDSFIHEHFSILETDISRQGCHSTSICDVCRRRQARHITARPE